MGIPEAITHAIEQLPVGESLNSTRYWGNVLRVCKLGDAKVKKGKFCTRANWLIRSAFISSFSSMNRLGVFLLPIAMGCWVHHRVNPSIKFAGTHLYTWVERRTVRVKCLAEEHNTVSPARAQTRPLNLEASVVTMKPMCIVGGFTIHLITNLSFLEVTIFNDHNITSQTDRYKRVHLHVFFL